MKSNGCMYCLSGKKPEFKTLPTRFGPIEFISGWFHREAWRAGDFKLTPLNIQCSTEDKINEQRSRE